MLVFTDVSHETVGRRACSRIHRRRAQPRPSAPVRQRDLGEDGVTLQK